MLLFFFIWRKSYTLNRNSMHVAVLDDVFLAFDAEAAGFAGLGEGAEA